MGRMNVQARVRSALAAALPGVEVRVSVPDPRPPTLVVVRREGGRRENGLVDRAGVGVDVWARTEADASELAMRVSDAMLGLSFADGFARVEEESLRSDYDAFASSPRWYGSYTVLNFSPRE